MFKLFIFCAVLLVSCAKDDAAGAGTTSETQNAEIKLTQPNIATPMARQNINWIWQVNDSLELTLGYLNDTLKESNLNEKSNWLLINKINEIEVSSELLSDVDVEKLEVALMGADSINLNLIFNQDSTTFIINSELKIVIPKKGMTWKFGNHDLELGILYSSCSGGYSSSNSISGCVSSCEEPHSILCYIAVDWNRPAYPINPTSVIGEEQGYTQGWGGGKFALSAEIKGSELVSQLAGDEICKTTFGSSAKMATYSQSLYHKDMGLNTWVGNDFSTNLDSLKVGGWGYWVKLDNSGEIFVENAVKRFWVAQTAENGNCWSE